jgi:hypothetical protein
VVPRGIRFNVTLLDGPARGYVLEVFQGHFGLPDLGPIGGWGRRWQEGGVREAAETPAEGGGGQ